MNCKESLEEIEETFWASNQHLLSKENYPSHFIDGDGRPITPVQARIPIGEGNTLISYQWPYWDDLGGTTSIPPDPD
jgi:hypothetical protein